MNELKIKDFNELQLKYLIADTEVLYDYFSLQIKNEKSNVSVIEIENDKGFHNLYELFKNFTRPIYFYGVDYDPIIVNAMCKFVESGTPDINYNLRKVSDYIIYNRLNYFRLNRSFWCDHYFKFKENDENIPSKELFQRSVDAFSGNITEYNFLNEYPELMGQSKVFKNMNWLSIPKINYYFSIRQDKSIVPTISLKNLQLIDEGYNVKFDLGKYKTIADIKKDNLYEDFKKYGINDVLSLEKQFLKKPKGDILKRWYAYQAVKEIDPNFEISEDALYSENNTNLICEILKLPDSDKKSRNEITVNYTDYINSSDKKFNEFVDFVNKNQNVRNDRELKEQYCDFYQTKYLDDDKNIFENNLVTTAINSFDEIHIQNKFNDIWIKFGLGGLHGAIPNHLNTNMLHLDYKSQYPSIILQYKELFKDVINIPLYEAIYNLKFKIGEKITALKKENESQLEIIEVGGNDGADIAVYEEREKEIEGLEKIQVGIKLILNTAFGLINSNFDIPISCKSLGRFICLKGQSLLLNLCYLFKDNCKLININTDGIILRKMIDPIPIIKPDGYFILDETKMSKIIQNDVNNYIAQTGNKYKKRGMFNLKIKQFINKNEKLSINLENALNIIQEKDIEKKPIYFDKRWFAPEIVNNKWYLTTEKKGRLLVKNTKKPEILSILVNDLSENIYFTDNELDADYSIYYKYADIVKNQILNFTYNSQKNVNNLFYEEKLIKDDADNIKEKRKTKRELHKLFNSKTIGMVGYKGNNKINSFVNQEAIKPLIQYTMTDILTSTYCTGFSIENNKSNQEDPYIIFDLDLYNKKTGTIKKGWEIIKPFLKKLKNAGTFECWNLKTQNYNRKYIFINHSNFIDTWNTVYKSYHNYIELIDKATIYTVLGDIKYDCNWKPPIELPANLHL